MKGLCASGSDTPGNTVSFVKQMSQKGIYAFFHEATSEKPTLRDNLYNSRLVFFKIRNDMKKKKRLKIGS